MKISSHFSITTLFLGFLCGFLPTEVTSSNYSTFLISTTHYEPNASNSDISILRNSIETMELNYKKVNDYTATLYKRERINGRLQPLETIAVKFKKPYQMYMRWEAGPHQAQELIYRQGWNANKMRVHPGAFPDVTIDLAIDSRMAKKGNRHTVDQADLGFAIDQIAQDFRRSQTRPQDTIQFKDLGSEVVHGAASRCGEMAFVVSQEASPYYAPRAQICIEHTTGLPNRVRIWDDQNQLLEEYSYKNLRINVGLDDQDFDPNNTAYNF